MSNIKCTAGDMKITIMSIKINIVNRIIMWPQWIPNITLYELTHWESGCRADSRFASSQWETALLCNDVSHWLDTNLESALIYMQCTGSSLHRVTTCRLFRAKLELKQCGLVVKWALKDKLQWNLNKLSIYLRKYLSCRGLELPNLMVYLVWHSGV